MRFALPFAALLVVATGCPSYVPYQPDGGRARVNCDATAVTAAVQVFDRAGDPAPGALLTIDYLGYGESEVVPADGRGVLRVGNKYGVGTVRVRGTVNDLDTQFGELNFVGTECSSAVTPRELFLTLQ